MPLLSLRQLTLRYTAAIFAIFTALACLTYFLFYDFARQQEQESRSYLKQIGNRFGDSASDIKIVIQSGAVVQEIIRAAQTEKADMVIMASHGWSGGRRNFYGSVVSGVLNQIDRPLLLIRSRMAE